MLRSGQTDPVQFKGRLKQVWQAVFSSELLDFYKPRKSTPILASTCASTPRQHFSGIPMFWGPVPGRRDLNSCRKKRLSRGTLQETLQEPRTLVCFRGCFRSNRAPFCLVWAPSVPKMRAHLVKIKNPLLSQCFLPMLGGVFLVMDVPGPSFHERNRLHLQQFSMRVPGLSGTESAILNREWSDSGWCDSSRAIPKPL